MKTTLDAWQEFQSQLLSFIQKKVNIAQDAEDILQDVFLKIHLNISQQKIENYKAWLYQITRNTIYDFYKKKKMSNITEESFQPLFTNDEMEQEEFKTCLIKMIKLLPEKDREALQATGINGKTQIEYAQEKKLSIPGAKSRIQRARVKLLQEIQECCKLEFDKRGNLVDWHRQDNRTAACTKCS